VAVPPAASMADADAQTRAQLTYRYERWRAVASGIIETAGSTFLVLIAVRWYHAGPVAKALVASGTSVGLLLGPWFVKRVERWGGEIGVAAAHVSLVGAVGFSIMALCVIEPVFVLGSVVSMACASAVIPLLTQIYQENYPESDRGWLFSRTMVVRIATAAVFSHVAGRLLTNRIGYFPVLLLLFACAYLVSAYCLGKIPSRRLVASGATHPFGALKYAKHDALFRQTLIAWMFLGFANLMMVPLRVEYLANEKYGVTIRGAQLSVGAIALLTGVLPNIARLVMNPVWGWLFDRMNFFALRIILNMGFMVGILAFFTTDSLAGLIAGALVYGVSIAGGDVAWSLWVTKFAPAERVADYMAVHTFFTGLRGVIAPVVGFQLASVLPLPTIGWLSAGLIMVACLILIPEVRSGGLARRAPALVEEVSE